MLILYAKIYKLWTFFLVFYAFFIRNIFIDFIHKNIDIYMLNLRKNTIIF